MTYFTRHFLTILGSTLLASLFWGLLAQLDPFGVKTAANFHSESIFLRFIGGPLYSSDAQNKITVLLIDDKYLSVTESSWPMSYLDQDFLLNTLMDYEPRAVFLDLLYRHRHGEGEEADRENEELEQLVTTIRNSAAVTTFIPYLINDVEGEKSCKPGPHSFAETINKDSVIDELQKTGAIRTYLGWKGCGNRYPALIFGDKEYRTPAFALYQSSCTQKPTDAKEQTFAEWQALAGCKDAKRTSPSAFLSPMMIRWGTGVSEIHNNALARAEIHCTSFDNYRGRISYSLRQFKTAASQAFEPPTEIGLREHCTYTDTVHATWFLGASDELRENLKKMLKDRIVLVGTQIDGVHDTILSPVNGQLPGVYLFAMALDNYLEYGSDYYKEMTSMQRMVLELTTLWFITFLIGLIGPEGKLKNVLLTIALFRICLPFGFSLFIVVMMWTFRYAPMDWIGITVLSFIADPMKITIYLEDGGRKLLPSIYGESSKESGIWLNITSWLGFLLQRLHSHPVAVQLLRKLWVFIRKTFLSIRIKDERSVK